MTPEQITITRLYNAFTALDPDTMATCYAPNVQFEDEAFVLQGQEEVIGMWRMLCEAVRAKGQDVWKLEFSNVQGSNRKGSAHWEPVYRFSSTRRIVHNKIDSVFEFDAQGRITRQRDRFNFWRWSAQALGAPGYLLGWSGFLRGKVQSTARANLQQYLARTRR
jgi:SnoaL-like domain